MALAGDTHRHVIITGFLPPQERAHQGTYKSKGYTSVLAMTAPAAPATALPQGGSASTLDCPAMLKVLADRAWKALRACEVLAAVLVGIKADCCSISLWSPRIKQEQIQAMSQSSSGWHGHSAIFKQHPGIVLAEAHARGARYPGTSPLGRYCRHVMLPPSPPPSSDYITAIYTSYNRCIVQTAGDIHITLSVSRLSLNNSMQDISNGIGEMR
jgi:hypothetical protein